MRYVVNWKRARKEEKKILFLHATVLLLVIGTIDKNLRNLLPDNKKEEFFMLFIFVYGRCFML